MARDPQQTFYYHNKVVLRGLVFASLTFILIATVFWWRSAQHNNQPSAESLVIREFSGEAAMAEATSQYIHGAKHIHDIERYPELRERFFGQFAIGFSSSQALEAELAEVQAAHARLSEDEKRHVYYTSYYVGNVLSLPGITLHEQLLGDRLQTATLLETALADVRAGVIKIGSHYDVAPPYFYDPTLAGAIYYPAPSSPSLTVSEVAIALYLLAEIDPIRSRVYEQQLVEYAEQVLASGAHFPSDIQAALDLARMYFHIIMADESYRPLLNQARTEWSTYTVSFEPRTESIPERRFIIRDFPYQSTFFVDRIISKSYVPNTVQENISGTLRLTLDDLRVPEVGLRLYEYEWGRDDIVPIALDLSSRQYPFLLDSLERASYSSGADYYFLSRDATRSRIIHTQGEKVSVVTGLDSIGSLTGFEVRPENGLAVLTERLNTATRTRTHLVEVSNDSARVLRTVDDLTSPTIVDAEYVLFVDEASLVQVGRFQGDKVLALNGIEMLKKGGSVERKIQYFKADDLLMVSDTWIDPVSLVPETTISLYSVDILEERADASLLYSATFVDARINDVELSPGGRYMALLAEEALGGRQTNILLFDIMNGIIIREIDISDFNPSTASLDGWMVF